MAEDTEIIQIIFDYLKSCTSKRYSLQENNACLEAFVLKEKAIYINCPVSDNPTESGEKDDVSAANSEKMPKAFIALDPCPDTVMVVIKSSADLTSDNLDEQLFIVHLPKNKFYSTVLDYIHYAISPVFKANEIEENKQGMQVTVKKLAELELSLVHLQQNIQIPTVTLKTHPKITDLMQQKLNVNDLIKDSSFLNEIQSNVNSWIKEIQKVTLLDRNVNSGTASQEIEFWIQMERSLNHIEDALKQPEILKTLEILKSAKRFHATVSFIADTGIKEAAEKVLKYNQLMKEFPINELLTASDLEKIRNAVEVIFAHFIKKLKLAPYPMARALAFCEAISRDLNDQILKVLSKNLLYMEFKEFEKVMSQCSAIFSAWETNINSFISVGRDMTRKRMEPFIPVKVTACHLQLQERIQFIQVFRTQHEQFIQTIRNVIDTDRDAKNLADKNAVEEINACLEVIKAIDILDVSIEGIEAWENAEKLYNERIFSIEQKIISKLREKLGSSKNAADMFRIFSRFNALFVRPKIRGAIHEYQSQLIDRVKEDIKKLHEKFVSKHSSQESLKLTNARDIPSISGSVIWATSVEKQLNGYMKKVEYVLGKGWDKYAEGQKLLQDEASFKRQLNASAMVERWIGEESNRVEIVGKIFSLSRNRLQGNQFHLGVNFDSKSISVFKEVRNLLWLGYNIPTRIQNNAKNSKKVYPFAVSLTESLRIYQKTLFKISEHQNVKMLVGSNHITIQGLITKGVQLCWDNFIITYNPRISAADNSYVVFVREFAQAISTFQEKTFIAIEKTKEIEKQISELGHCRYDKATFEEIIGCIQKEIDALQFETFSNMESYCAEIHSRMEKVLLQRLSIALQEWTTGRVIEQFSGEPLVATLQIKNFLISLNPPLEHCKKHYASMLSEWLSVICSLPKLKVFMYDRIEQETTFSGLLLNVDRDILKNTYNYTEQLYGNVDMYVRKWFQYQSLWDLETRAVFDVLSDNLNAWSDILVQVRKQRGLFDTSKSIEPFPGLRIDFGHIQTKVNAQYDSWQLQLISKYSDILNQKSIDYFNNMKSKRNQLETLGFNGSIEEVVCTVTLLNDIKLCKEEWPETLKLLQNGQTLLERQRVTFPTNWIYYDQIFGEYSALMELYRRKSTLLDDLVDQVKQKILDANHISQASVESMLQDWDEQKPTKGNLKPSEGLRILGTFKRKFEAEKKTLEVLYLAKKAMKMDFKTADKLLIVLEDLTDHSIVMEKLVSIWDSMEDIKRIRWVSEECWNVQSSLDALNQKLKEMPTRMRQYSSFQAVQVKIFDYDKLNTKCLPLRSEALRDRHWSMLLNLMKIQSTLISLTVGDVWDSLLKTDMKAIDQIIVNAQGEMALEQFLKQVKSSWELCSLDFVNFQNKVHLIKGWDTVLNKLQDHLAALSAMKSSSHFKTFKEESLNLEESLSKLYFLLDVWMGVQKKWVYLHGIFCDNREIKQILPLESTRFNSVDSEFTNILRKVYRSPLVMDVLSIPNLFQTVQKLGELLTGIQKSLGEYLDRERSSFSRFYFLSDEDLLEILGNSRDSSRLQAHLKKMYPGINDLMFSDTMVTGVISKEGEQVQLLKPFSTKDRKVNEWLDSLSIELKSTLFENLLKSLRDNSDYTRSAMTVDGVEKWLNSYPAQVLILTTQCHWTNAVETELENGLISNLCNPMERIISIVSQILAKDLGKLERSKSESLITELVHQRDIIRQLVESNVSSSLDYLWMRQMRFYSSNDKLEVKMGNTVFDYGFEYLGIQEQLVQTPLTDQCFLTLCQALDNRVGGSPFGPAGTGKTESVKALASKLGRQCLVFCCDEGFDFHSIGRILIGISMVGAWCCFDEFNRLEEKILSAVSQQIQSIQGGLKSPITIEMIGKELKVHPDTGIFITMNPGYAGRSTLPDNLTSLFRSVSMSAPDKLLITQVMLFSQGFSNAEKLASKIIPFFEISKEQFSEQSHYDFGLRALKSVLLVAGKLKRLRKDGQNEESILAQSIRESVFPKLVQKDVKLANILLQDLFSDAAMPSYAKETLIAAMCKFMDSAYLIADECWLEKALQLHGILEINHGVMLVGLAGSGKTALRRTLFKALEYLDGHENVLHVLDPKSVTKEVLYGSLDSTTREWTDGIFTKILRTVIENSRGESQFRHWIVFDGDVDPEWIENLNSVLDDNKMLTLPNGERLPLPETVRIIFEVENLDFATPATVSRCGMVWLPQNLVSISMLFKRYLGVLENVPVDEIKTLVESSESFGAVIPSQLRAGEIMSVLDGGSLLNHCFTFTESLVHVMECLKVQMFDNFVSLMNDAIKKIVDYESTHEDFPLSADLLEEFVKNSFFINLAWSLGGSLSEQERLKLSKFIVKVGNLPVEEGQLIYDYDMVIGSAGLIHWNSVVPKISIEPSRVNDSSIVIPTSDTLKHEKIIYQWLSEHRSVILCGPPGSGKSMTLLSSLRQLPETDVVPLNFSCETSCDLIIRTLEIHGTYKKLSSGEVFSPQTPGRWLVLFCDEINLPRPDSYGTQKVICFLRQLIETGGFWRKDRVFVKVENVQIIGASNPPTDPGRFPLSPRFLRHCPVIFVDYPNHDSLYTIYDTFSRTILKCQPALRGYSDALTSAMVNFFVNCRKEFTPEKKAHYIFSPRELTRWVRGIYEIIKPLEFIQVDTLLRIWAHEGLRLFQDRLIEQEEISWTEEQLNLTAEQFFPGVNVEQTLARPILFSNFSSRNYESAKLEPLRDFIKQRQRSFFEEELDVPIVLFDSALDHILRIDRVFRQTQGHLLLIGISGSGKTTLTRFVAWMNGITVVQFGMHRRYSITDFEDDLKLVLKRAGCKSEKLCLILDEGSITDSAFLERINTLLANAEIPGLFEGDEYNALMTQCKDEAHRCGQVLESHEDLYKWFTLQVAKNLHIVYTMNPPEGAMNKKATTSPALFNRCVLNWMGDWNTQTLYQVASEILQVLDLHRNYTCPSSFYPLYSDLNQPYTYRDVFIDMFLYVHQSSKEMNEIVSQRLGSKSYVTPRQYVDLLSTFSSLYNDKRSDLERRQRHLVVGLEKLQETFEEVKELQKSLDEKKVALEFKSDLANEKLKTMVCKQQEAENRRADSLKISENLSVKNQQIEERKSVAMSALAKAEPAVLEAKQSVSNINKQHLTEVRSMGNPPAAVKQTMESVCILLGHKVDTWKSVTAVLRRDDFISSIVNYDTTVLPESARNAIVSQYLTDPNFCFETVNRASRACGPLLNWVVAQIDYATILQEVGPLRLEVQALEASAAETMQQVQQINLLVEELEKTITVYKDEYAVLISEVQSLKKEMDTVKDKVARSMRILENLSSEKDRWEEAKDSFATQMNTIVGDTFVAAAFLVYAGIFDQKKRQKLVQTWQTRMKDANIAYTTNIQVSAFLSDTEERKEWQDHSLPTDNLCQENAVILKHSQRFPLVIDPDGQALEYIKSVYKKRNITVTSFSDGSYLKVLESALRFGTPLIIQDAEAYDTILNPILSREIRKSGGRQLCQLGKKEVDFAPSFRLFLIARSTQDFSPDICSRVTFVNFTTTPSSLSLTCVDRLMMSQRPDIEEKRKDLMKLQGEYQRRLHNLEGELLDALNRSQCNILDDDMVMDTLETLKMEAFEVMRKVKETSEILVEVEEVTSAYYPLAKKVSAIYFTLEQLSTVDHFYQFSLKHYLETFDYVLSKQPQLCMVGVIEDALFATICQEYSLTLRSEDLPLFGILLAQIKSSKAEASNIENEWWTYFVNGADLSLTTDLKGESELIELFGAKSALKLHQLFNVKGMSTLKVLFFEKLNSLKEYLSSSESAATAALYTLLKTGEFETNPAKVQPFQLLLLLKCLFPERLFEWVQFYLKDILCCELSPSSEKLAKAISFNDQKELNLPIVLCSDKGYDVSHRVEALAKSYTQELISVAMGSTESLKLADSALAQASHLGHWVLIKNAHLAVDWVKSLEKRISSLPSGGLKLFITTETLSSFPQSVLRLSKVLMFEPPKGIRSNLLDLLNSIEKNILVNGPYEKHRVYFMLAWLHAVILERLRYIPLGWSKTYDFNDSDFELNVKLTTKWFDQVATGRSNITPQNIPWEAIRKSIAENVYGGKIDRIVDCRTLSVLVDQFINPGMFDDDFTIVHGDSSIKNPSGTLLQHFIDWTKNLPDCESPIWIGLSKTSDKLMKKQRGIGMLTVGKKLVAKLCQFNAVVQYEHSNTALTNISLVEQIKTMLAALDIKLKPWSKNEEKALERFYSNEIGKALDLLNMIRYDLNLSLQVLEGSFVSNNQSRQLIETLKRGAVPSKWSSFSRKSGGSTLEFVRRFSTILNYLLEVTKSFDLLQVDVCVQKLFDPFAFLTASRQTTAKDLKLSLENLQLHFSFSIPTAKLYFKVSNLTIFGAKVISDKIVLTDDLEPSELTLGYLYWQEDQVKSKVFIPVFTNHERSEILFNIAVGQDHENAKEIILRSVAIIA